MHFLKLNNRTYKMLYHQFDNLLIAKGYSRAKEHFYSNMMKEFLFFIENSGINSIQQVNGNHILAYYNYLRERPNQRRAGGLSDSAIRSKMFSLRLFFNHLVESGILNASPVYLPSTIAFKSTGRKVLSKEEVMQLYSACKNSFEKALLALAYGCGLRKTEIFKLNVSDIYFTENSLLIRCGKLNKTRTVPLSASVAAHLKEYIVNERTTHTAGNAYNPAFFITPSGARVKADRFYECIKRLVKRTNNPALQNKQVGLHTLRHSIATHLADNGADIDFIREFLGHVLLDTTHIYCKHRKQKQRITEAINHSKIAA
ncbi:MAG: tyrosine-type recombinase/integrase [Bacteroidetes bacterium]|nr:tyrosine-type recombinase/integrase [Bacteroidota bacterium]